MQQFTGLEWIKISIANAYGLDKLTWDERLQWVDKKSDRLDFFTKTAAEPLLYQKGLNALADALAGIPTGFIMGLDATQSGLQIMASLIGCITTARNVNLVDTGKREDAYGMVAGVMNKCPGVDVTRSVIKSPTMTTFYGSKAEPRNVFGEGTPALKEFYLTLNKELPGACECMGIMQSCWQSDALYHSWELPDKHVAKVRVMAMQQKKIEVDEMDHATFTHQAEVNEAQDEGLSLAANIVQSVDGYIGRCMKRLAEKQGFELLCIFDSFWASPNHMNKVCENYRNIMAAIADSTLLQDILNAITGSPNGKLEKNDEGLGDLIRKSQYALS